MEPTTGKAHRTPPVPLPDGFDDRLERLQRELLRDLRKEKTWRRRFKDYYDAELYHVLKHLNAAKVTSSLDKFYEILNEDPAARKELLAEAMTWGVAPAGPDQHLSSLATPVVASSGRVVENEVLWEAGRTVEGAQFLDSVESYSMTKKRKAEEEGAPQSLEDWVEQTKGGAVGDKPSLAEEKKTKKRRKNALEDATRERKGHREVAVHQEGDNRSSGETRSADAAMTWTTELDEEGGACTKRGWRRSRRLILRPFGVTSARERNSAGSTVDVKWGSKVRFDSEELGASIKRNEEKEIQAGYVLGDVEEFKPPSDRTAVVDRPDEDEVESVPIREVIEGSGPLGTRASQTSAGAKAPQEEVAITSGVLNPSTTSNRPKRKKRAKPQQIAEDAGVPSMSVTQATEFAKNNPGKVFLLEGEGRCLKCKEGNLNCWKPTDGRRKTCYVCQYAHKQCAWTGRASADSGRNPVNPNLRRSEGHGLETILAVAMDLDNMNVGELKTTLAVGEDGEEEGALPVLAFDHCQQILDVEVSYSAMVASLAPGVPILVHQTLHLREAQEQLRQKVDRLENLVESQSILLQEEMSKSAGRATEVTRYQREAREKLDRMENLLQHLAAQGCREPSQSATLPPGPPSPSTAVGFSTPQSSTQIPGASLQHPAGSIPHLRQNLSSALPGSSTPAAVLASKETAPAGSTGKLPLMDSSTLDLNAQGPLAEASGYPATSGTLSDSILARRPVAHHLLANAGQHSTLALLSSTSTTSTALQTPENHGSLLDEDILLAQRSEALPTIPKKRKANPSAGEISPPRITRSLRRSRTINTTI